MAGLDPATSICAAPINREDQLKMHSLDLDFVSAPVFGNKDSVRMQKAQIRLKDYTGDGKGQIYLTEHCVSFSELETHINRLQAELEEIGKAGRRKFSEADRKNEEIRSRHSAD